MAIAADVSNMTDGMASALVNDIVNVNQNHVTVRNRVKQLQRPLILHLNARVVSLLSRPCSLPLI